jgi:tetratricopeptide (TPR) repeat protein
MLEPYALKGACTVLRGREVSNDLLLPDTIRWCRRKPWVAASVSLLLLGTGLSTWQAVRATVAQRTARNERNRAEREAANARAINEFLTKDLLAQASADNQARLGIRPDRDLTVRTALDRAAAQIGQRFVNQPLLEASIRQTIGETYYQLGLYPKALEQLLTTLELRCSTLGEAHPDTMVAMEAVRQVHLADARLPDAEPYLVGALEGLRKLRGPEHPDTLAAANLLAQLYYRQNRGSEAEALFTTVRDAYRATRGDDDPETIDVTHSLALVHLGHGRLELAEGMLLGLLEVTRRALGNDHPSLFMEQTSLAEVYQAQGRNDEAARLFAEVVAAQTRVLGAQHPNTLLTMAKLGFFYVRQGKLTDAEPLLTKALQGCRAALDRNHDTTDLVLVALAEVFSGKGDWQQLGPVLIEAADIQAQRWGIENGITKNAYSASAFYLVFRREYPRAEPYFRGCVAFWEKEDTNHPERFLYELWVGVCLLAQKHYDEARSRLLIAYNGMRPDREKAPPLETTDLGWLIEQLTQLRDAKGHPLRETTLSTLHRDPDLEAIVLDLQFPADPFVP